MALRLPVARSFYSSDHAPAEAEAASSTLRARRLLARPAGLLAVAMAMGVAVLLCEPAAAQEALKPWQEPAVRAALRDPAASVRHAAVQWLATRGTGSAPLARTLSDFLGPDNPPQVRIGAAQALGRSGAVGAAFAQQVSALLQDPDATVRDGAAGSLANMGAAAGATAPALAARLNDSSSRVRYDVADALERMGTAAAPVAPRLAAVLDNNAERTDVHEIALRALASTGSAARPFAPQIARLLQDANYQVRPVAATVLAGLGPSAVALLPQIAAQLKDPQAVVRADMAEALGGMAGLGPPVTALAPQVAALLRDPDPNTRRAAALALGQMGAAAFAPQIARMLADADAKARGAAAVALGDLRPASAAFVPQIVALLGDPKKDAWTGAAEGLGAMLTTVPAVSIQVMALLKKPGLPGNAMDVLEAAGLPAAPQLAALLPDLRYRDQAVEILGHLGPGAARYAQPIAALLKDSVGDLDQFALHELEALGRMGVAAVAPEVAVRLTDSDRNFRRLAVQDLGLLQAVDFVPQLTERLKDADPAVRAAAADALGALGSATAPVLPQLDAALRDADPKVRSRVVAALDGPVGAAARQDSRVVLDCLYAAEAVPVEAGGLVLRAYLYSSLDDHELILIRWLGSRTAEERPAVTDLDREGARAALKAFADNWEAAQPLPGLRKEMADRIAEVASARSWALTDAPLLESLHGRLQTQYPAQAVTVQAVLERNAWFKKLRKSAGIICAHIAAWIALIFAYPRSRWVQSFFFWNKWGRRFLGAGYVGLLITYVPWLRRRMLQPFQDSLLPPGIREHFKAQAYFAGSDVLLEKDRRTEPGRLALAQALPVIRGQVVLKGHSGLGKTLALLRLALAEKEPVVFLRATECADGVGLAIQKKLHGQLRDANYLRALIHAGALKVLIDGLNEAPPDTRARITQFVEEYFSGDFILTTQPLSGDLPATARVYVLQPLLPEQIEPFLLQQWAVAQERAVLDHAGYQAAVARYVQSFRADQGGLDRRLVALSSPMDASLAAELLARGETPDMFRLVEQHYRVMAQSFHEEEGREFQLEPFAERVYEWRSSGAPDINIKGFEAEVGALVKERLMIERMEVIRGEKGKKTVRRWFFRHDKIMEFFLLPAFMGAHAGRRLEHDQDERFWGVYELLAVQLPDDEESRLYQLLIEKAADLNKNDLQNRYTLARRFRKVARQDEDAVQAA